MWVSSLKWILIHWNSYRLFQFNCLAKLSMSIKLDWILSGIKTFWSQSNHNGGSNKWLQIIPAWRVSHCCVSFGVPGCSDPQLKGPPSVRAAGLQRIFLASQLQEEANKPGDGIWREKQAYYPPVSLQWVEGLRKSCSLKTAEGLPSCTSFDPEETRELHWAQTLVNQTNPFWFPIWCWVSLSPLETAFLLAASGSLEPHSTGTTPSYVSVLIWHCPVSQRISAQQHNTTPTAITCRAPVSVTLCLGTSKITDSILYGKAVLLFPGNR